MRAIVLSGHGGPEMLELVERPEPSPRAGEALVRVAAVAVNRLDIWVREDVGHAYGATLPLIPGYDVAGEVVGVGDGVSDVAPGARVYVHYDFSCGRCPYCLEGDEAACAVYGVMGVTRDGGYAEQIVAPARNLFALPGGVSFETAAAAGSVYLTAYHMLFSRAHLGPGETVLVTAAGSGVGGAAIALARFAGARVLATASTDAKRRRALAAGVEHAIDYTDPGWPAEVRELTAGRGVDLVVDHVGAAAVPGALAALANKGRVVICGASSGPRIELDLIDLFARQIALIGSSDGSRRELWEVLRLLGDGLIDPPAIEAVLPLEEAVRAQEILATRAHYGRVLLRP
ncbi:MAG TPA: zinc-binding dehydrogenase [Gaiellales bacterium]|jgi:NADPH:quinone reductase-like Zn-dependent oxidoreductase|nr:zinc-binding dehydrogenase [Gaiellales bacterium]